MTTLFMTKGLPGSGKTTWALKQLEANPGWKRVNKDDLRAMLHGGRHSNSNESFVKRVRDLIVEAALSDDRSVIVDDTNLHPAHEVRLRELADDCAADFKIQSFLDVPLKECIARDLMRARSVGEHVIRQHYNQFVKEKPVTCVQDPKLPHAVIVDIDGTLALKGERSAYDWARVGEDAPNRPVIDLLKCLQDRQDRPEIILFSGRDAVCRGETEKWLLGHFVSFQQLHMRPEGNTEKDSIIKQRMFDEHVRGKFFVEFVLDDRNQVVEMWRDNGLTCFQVAEGNF